MSPGTWFFPGAIDLGARFVPGAIALGARFVPGDHFWVPTSTRNFQKKSIFQGEKFFFRIFLLRFWGHQGTPKNISKIFLRR